MTPNVNPTPSLAGIQDEIADADLDKVSGGDKAKTAPSHPSVSEIVVTKVQDCASAALLPG